MFNFLHTYNPTPILISFGPINIYWYGLFIVAGMLAAIFTALKLAGFYKMEKNVVIDAVFYIIIAGIVGARLFHVALELPFYFKNPLDIFKIWQGGLAIHGAIIAGFAAAWRLAKKHSINFWQLAAICAPALSLAQAIGRWGNYFNQELFGRPTSLPWGIPIEPASRALAYYNYAYFHPTFLYESIGNLIIFIFLLLVHFSILKGIKNGNLSSWIFRFSSLNLNLGYALCVASYLIMYSVLRFLMEFIRVDPTPEIFGLRLPQITSLIIIGAALFLFRVYKKKIAGRLEINNNT